MKNAFPTCLVILDGVGYRQDADRNAVAHADMPHFSHLLASYPWTTLLASGPAVGLPQGYPGNSEIGHLTIGCGAIIKQPITVLEEALAVQDVAKIPKLEKIFLEIAQTGTTLHLMGLFSEGGVHALSHHLFFFIRAAQACGITSVVIHPFLDGCDIEQGDALHTLHELESMLQTLGVGKIGSIHGRFYAMDRNKNWHLTQESYQVLTQEQASDAQAPCWQTVLEQAVSDGITQDCIKPVQLQGGSYVRSGDSVLFFNFRADRARQLTQLFVKGRDALNGCATAHFITPVSYGVDCPTTVLFPTETTNQTLMGMLNDQGYSLCTISETEKHAQVTYFFNGGREEKFTHETRIVIPSSIEKKSNAHFTMQAESITQAAVESLRHNPHDFYLINYANADVMAHTGNFEATVQAIEFLDKQLGVLFDEVVVKRNGVLCITADHGNAEDMALSVREKVSRPHTSNPVYFLMAKQDLEHKYVDLPLEQLSDIAPFIAHMVLEES